MSQKIALLLGASGSVGSEVLNALLQNSAYEKVVIFGRKPIKNSAKLMQKMVPAMTPSNLKSAVAETLSELEKQYPQLEIMAFSALGVGAKTADLTLEEHRAVDVVLNQAFAESLKANVLVKSLNFLSAVGSNPHAKTTGSGAAGMPRYARVKGEAEEAVKLHGPKVVNIFRPAMIRGSQHTPKAIELVAPFFDFIIPKKFHSVSTKELGQAMVNASLLKNESSQLYHYSEMRNLLQNLKS